MDDTLVHPKENGKYFNKILFDIVGLKCTIFVLSDQKFQSSSTQLNSCANFFFEC